MSLLPPSHFNHQVRIYFEDTDAGGVIYHASYVRFYERARTEWLRAQGHHQTELLEGHDGGNGKFGFVVVKMELDYLRAGRLDDLLTISVVVEAVGNASVTLKQETYCIESGGKVLAEPRLLNRAQVKLVYVDLIKMKPLAIAQPFRSLFTAALQDT
ncbi:YbgC/FadM family acyl-CoA thioesterase [Parvibium lacunae]|uniref:Thioesterase domain-containing protein n=1 Tax=Parvibium lacunae TaxID=1888893 RepID=A0A368L3G8_9BURK|nr:YbgC/FadM family acyl-CoA thioesterase [Parvibium lacunae]RCS58104.1 hypothetical protein DU000_04495 [Parvibium lacunae]